jgi:OOP family OmpA-OmpF porin
MMHTRKFFGAFAAGLLVCAGARADDSGFYLGASVGEATQSADGFDGSDTSFKWLAGYSFNKYLAAEAGFVDGGTQKDTIGALDVTASSDGFFAAVLAKLPLGTVVAPYAKLGYVVYDSTTTASAGGARFSEDFHDDDLLYGIGCEFRLGKNFRLRAEYEQVDVPDADFEIVSVVATFQF